MVWEILVREFCLVYSRLYRMVSAMQATHVLYKQTSV